MATTRICSVPGCGKPHLARGWCNKHLHRWRRHGNPTTMTRAARGEPGAFMASLYAMGTDECVIWPFARDENGYGEIYVGDGLKRDVHTIVCAKINGPRPHADIDACHSCGNGKLGCVNPKHIRWDTKKANSKDSLIHGTRKIGEEKPGAHFTNSDIVLIRQLLVAGYRNIDIAWFMGVDPRRICDIKKNRSYGRVGVDGQAVRV